MRRHGTADFRRRAAAVPPGILAVWLVLLLLLLVLEPPALRLIGLVVFELLAPLALVTGAFCWMVRLASGRAVTGPLDALAVEETARRRRLGELRTRTEQMQSTLRDLRTRPEGTRLGEAETTRARWAEADLEAALLSVCEQMAAERAGLARVEAVRWLECVEPLLRELELLDDGALQRWLDRLGVLRTRGTLALGRLREDVEARGTRAPGALWAAPGAEAERLLESVLAELTQLRAELLTRRAELLARSVELAPGELPEVDHPAALRLRELLERSRARRELRGDPAEDEPGGGAP